MLLPVSAHTPNTHTHTHTHTKTHKHTHTLSHTHTSHDFDTTHQTLTHFFLFAFSLSCTCTYMVSETSSIVTRCTFGTCSPFACMRARCPTCEQININSHFLAVFSKWRRMCMRYAGYLTHATRRNCCSVAGRDEPRHSTHEIALYVKTSLQLQWRHNLEEEQEDWNSRACRSCSGRNGFGCVWDAPYAQRICECNW
jgi:hypothetical protein